MTTNTIEQRKRNVPKNLKEVLAGDQSGYIIKRGYILEVDHRLMSFNPLAFKGSLRIVIVFDLDLLMRVGSMAKPERFKITSNLFHVNERLGVAYPVLPDTENSNPQFFLTAAELDGLSADDIEWGPGLLHMSPRPLQDDYLRNLEAAIEKERQSQ